MCVSVLCVIPWPFPGESAGTLWGSSCVCCWCCFFLRLLSFLCSSELFLGGLITPPLCMLNVRSAGCGQLLVDLTSVSRQGRGFYGPGSEPGSVTSTRATTAFHGVAPPHEFAGTILVLSSAASTSVPGTSTSLPSFWGLWRDQSFQRQRLRLPCPPSGPLDFHAPFLLLFFFLWAGERSGESDPNHWTSALSVLGFINGLSFPDSWSHQYAWYGPQ